MSSGGTSLLLLVPVLLAAIATQRMRLIAAFSLSLSSLRLYTRIVKVSIRIIKSASVFSKHGSGTAPLLANHPSNSLTISTHLINNKVNTPLSVP